MPPEPEKSLRPISRKSVPFEIKSFDEEGRTFTGLPATWDVDLDKEQFVKGCWKKSIEEWRNAKRQRPIYLLDQHKHDSIMHAYGQVIDLAETPEGLEAKFSIIDGPDGERFANRLKNGIVRSLSVGFQTLQSSKGHDMIDGIKQEIRLLKEVKLFEISAVLWGAQPGAMIDAVAVKSLFKAAEERELTPEERAVVEAVAVPPDVEEKETETPEANVSADTAEEEASETEQNELLPLEKELAAKIEAKRAAVEDEDYDLAGTLRDEILGLEARLARKKKEEKRAAKEKPSPGWEPDDPQRLMTTATVLRLQAYTSSFE